MPRASEPNADHIANRRARSEQVESDNHTRIANAAYVSTPIGSVIAELSDRPSQIPGNNSIGPNPVSRPRPTQPPQMATNAGKASRRSGHVGTGRVLFGPESATGVTCTSSVGGATSVPTASSES